MFQFIKQKIRNILDIYPKYVCRREFETQSLKGFNERPVEFSYVFKAITEIYPNSILDIGSGATALPHLMRNCGSTVTATDNIIDYWPKGVINRHFHIINDDITNTKLVKKFDLITCISVLEHIQNPDKAVKNMFSLLNDNGHIVLSFPYNEKSYIKNVYDLPDSSYGKSLTFTTQSFSRNDLNRWLSENNGVIVDQEYWQFWTGEFWTVGKQIIPPNKVSIQDNHQLSCILIKKNFHLNKATSKK